MNHVTRKFFQIHMKMNNLTSKVRFGRHLKQSENQLSQENPEKIKEGSCLKFKEYTDTQQKFLFNGLSDSIDGAIA